MTWRPATKRPRNGQHVFILWLRSPTGVVTQAHYRPSVHGRAWEDVEAWIPESELIRAARAAAKGVK